MDFKNRFLPLFILCFCMMLPFSVLAQEASVLATGDEAAITDTPDDHVPQGRRAMRSGSFGKPSLQATKRYVPGGQEDIFGPDLPAAEGDAAYVSAGESEEGGMTDGEDVIYCDPGDNNPVVFVQFKTMPVRYKYNKSMAELGEMTRDRNFVDEDMDADEQGGRRTYAKHQTEMHRKFPITLGLTRTWQEGAFNIKPIIWGRNTKLYGCYVIESLQFDVLVNISVYIASEFLNNACMEGHVKEHENLHVQVSQEMAEKYEPVFKERLEAFVKGYKPRRLRRDQYKEESTKLYGEYRDIIKDVTAAMLEESDRLSILIDSNGEYSYGSLACN